MVTRIEPKPALHGRAKKIWVDASYCVAAPSSPDLATSLFLDHRGDSDMKAHFPAGALLHTTRWLRIGMDETRYNLQSIRSGRVGVQRLRFAAFAASYRIWRWGINSDSNRLHSVWQ